MAEDQVPDDEQTPEEGAQPSVPFFDETFALPDKVGSFALMRFAKLGELGVQSREMAGLAAMYDLLESSIATEDWPRFQACAMRNRADDDDLFAVVTSVLAALAGRPTSRPSGSSDGPSSTGPSSTSTPAERASARLAGRPELQHAIEQAQEVLSQQGS